MSYVHASQVKKLIKEKKNDPGISEYLDMEKELQEVCYCPHCLLDCNVPVLVLATCLPIRYCFCCIKAKLY